MSRKFKATAFRSADLVLVSVPPAADNPPLAVGDWCTMNSGSPPMLVVDVEEGRVSVSLPSGEEVTMPSACFRRFTSQGERT